MEFRFLSLNQKIDYLYNKFNCLVESLQNQSSETVTIELGEQNFTASGGQTVFIVTDTPARLRMVFMGRNLALEGTDYSYNNGTLTFGEGILFVGTKVKVIY